MLDQLPLRPKHLLLELHVRVKYDREISSRGHSSFLNFKSLFEDIPRQPELSDANEELSQVDPQLADLASLVVLVISDG